jgi:hypothetical protein
LAVIGLEEEGFATADLGETVLEGADFEGLDFAPFIPEWGVLGFFAAGLDFWIFARALTS